MACCRSRLVFARGLSGPEGSGRRYAPLESVRVMMRQKWIATLQTSLQGGRAAPLQPVTDPARAQHVLRRGSIFYTINEKKTIKERKEKILFVHVQVINKM